MLLPAAAIMTLGVPTASGANSAKFNTSKSKVNPGAKVKLYGNFPTAQTQSTASKATASGDGRGQVQIEFRPAGKRKWRDAKTTVTDGNGRYIEKVKVRISGRYRAVHQDGRSTSPEFVRVKSKLKSKVKTQNLMGSGKAKIKGQVVPRGSKRKIVVKGGNGKTKLRTRRNGKFVAKVPVSGTGSHKLKVIAKGDKRAAGSKDKAGKVTVYRGAHASYYGPGLYGNRTACGQTLTAGIVGVAHKSLPCGTKVKFHYRGRTVKAPVIDRGPYAAGREWDLTTALKNELGFGSTGTVWTNK